MLLHSQAGEGQGGGHWGPHSSAWLPHSELWTEFRQAPAWRRPEPRNLKPRRCRSPAVLPAPAGPQTQAPPSGSQAPVGSGLLCHHPLPRRRASGPCSRLESTLLPAHSLGHPDVTYPASPEASDKALCLQDKLQISELGVQDPLQSGPGLPFLPFLLRLPLSNSRPLSATTPLLRDKVTVCSPDLLPASASGPSPRLCPLPG